MVGDTVYKVGSYKEVVETESGNTRIVECGGGGYAPLYRVEWTEGERTQYSAHFEYPAAVASFENHAAA